MSELGGTLEILDRRFLITLSLGYSAQQVIGRGVVCVALKQFSRAWGPPIFLEG